MKTELRSRPHIAIRGASVFELWYGDQFIGEVAGADGPGVRIISKHDVHLSADELPIADGSKSTVNIVTVRVVLR